jgi:hypothetical protein
MTATGWARTMANSTAVRVSGPTDPDPCIAGKEGSCVLPWRTLSFGTNVWAVTFSFGSE